MYLIKNHGLYWYLELMLGADIDGQEDMRHICGIIVVEEKDKLEKGDKVVYRFELV